MFITGNGINKILLNVKTLTIKRSRILEGLKYNLQVTERLMKAISLEDVDDFGQSSVESHERHDPKSKVPEQTSSFQFEGFPISHPSLPQENQSDVDG